MTMIMFCKLCFEINIHNLKMQTNYKMETQGFQLVIPMKNYRRSENPIFNRYRHLQGNNDYEYKNFNVYFVENLSSFSRRAEVGFEPGTLSPFKHGTLVTLCMSQIMGQK